MVSFNHALLPRKTDYTEGANNMNIAMFRVGIDTGSGGIHGPVFSNNNFEFIPIKGADNKYTYGNTIGRHKRYLIDYFPRHKQKNMRDVQMHNDPEFSTFTYGDPNTGKHRLANLLKEGDIVIFFSGLEGWGSYHSLPAIYIIGYFVVSLAIHAKDYDDAFINKHFGNNAHVRNPKRYNQDKPSLVLIKGHQKESCLFEEAICISEKQLNAKNQQEDCLSNKMKKIFGHWGKLSSLKRNSTHWIQPDFIDSAHLFITSHHQTPPQ